MSAPKVDVLAVIDDLISDLDYSDPHERIDVVREARAAVAELIGTGAGALADLQAMVAASDRGEVWTVNAGTRLRLESLSAAVARIGGAQ